MFFHGHEVGVCPLSSETGMKSDWIFVCNSRQRPDSPIQTQDYFTQEKESETGSGGQTTKERKQEPERDP